MLVTMENNSQTIKLKYPLVFVSFWIVSDRVRATL